MKLTEQEKQFILQRRRLQEILRRIDNESMGIFEDDCDDLNDYSPMELTTETPR